MRNALRLVHKSSDPYKNIILSQACYQPEYSSIRPVTFLFTYTFLLQACVYTA